jgi:hypothetical protein
MKLEKIHGHKQVIGKQGKYFLAVLAGQLTKQNISSAERRAVSV